MDDEAVLTILKTNSTDQIPGLQENLVELEKLTKVRVKFEHESGTFVQKLLKTQSEGKFRFGICICIQY